MQGLYEKKKTNENTKNAHVKNAEVNCKVTWMCGFVTSEFHMNYKTEILRASAYHW